MEEQNHLEVNWMIVLIWEESHVWDPVQTATPDGNHTAIFCSDSLMSKKGEYRAINDQINK